MKVTVKQSTVVKPTGETPSGSMWLSNMDLIIKMPYYSFGVSFFPYNGSHDFFDTAALKAALSKALVDFYPFSGRLRMDDDGRLEIDCNAKGAVFLEAECDGTVEELGDFTPRDDVSFLPKIDLSQPISKLPLSIIQLTRFKCGGVCLGISNEHHVADGIAGLHYTNTWSNIARGLTTTTPPFFDRRLLSARHPPQPHFPHNEHQPPPSLNTSLNISHTSFRIFKLSPNQINTLKQKCTHKDDQGNHRSYTRYETIAGHIWRSVCIARQLPHDQDSKLRLPVDGRSRLRPPLPWHFFGNVIFHTTAVASCGEMEGNPVRFAVEKVHEAVVRIDDEYMRSVVDYLEMNLVKSQSVARSVSCPNLSITSWIGLPFYEADFGWGKPVYAGLGEASFEGKSYLLVDPQDEGGLLLAITLLEPHMDRFEKLLYDI